MSRRIWLIADDYALSPGVSEAIVDLIVKRRLSGTGCMTLFPEWPQEALRLRDAPADAAIGLHLTLTDQMALSGRSALAPEGRLPSLGRLFLLTAAKRDAARAAVHELDLQYDRFVDVMGRAPDFLDGHQHVHFLPVTRRWLRDRSWPDVARPFVRGAPVSRHAPRSAALKATVVGAMARGFDRFAQGLGFHAAGPLAGFYDWNDQQAFAQALTRAAAALPDDAVFMCHPGRVDPLLNARDRLRGPRAVELEFLASSAFSAAIERAGATIATMAR